MEADFHSSLVGQSVDKEEIWEQAYFSREKILSRRGGVEFGEWNDHQADFDEWSRLLNNYESKSSVDEDEVSDLLRDAVFDVGMETFSYLLENGAKAYDESATVQDEYEVPLRLPMPENTAYMDDDLLFGWNDRPLPVLGQDFSDLWPPQYAPLYDQLYWPYGTQRLPVLEPFLN